MAAAWFLAVAHRVLGDDAMVWVAVHAAAPVWHAALAVAAVGLTAAGRRTAGLMVALAWLVGWPRGPPHSELGPGAVAHGVRLRVAVANVAALNADAATAVEGLRDADVLVLPELTRAHAAALQDAGTLRAYPHAVEALADHPGSIALRSRHRILRDEVHDLLGATAVSARVCAAPKVCVTVLGVHLRAPEDARTRRLWQAQARALPALVASLPAPVVVAGDLNLPTTSPTWGALGSLGPQDAFLRVDRRPPATWVPAWQRLPATALGLPAGPAWLALDHVLVPADLAVDDVTTRVVPGSDHLAVVVDLRVPGPHGGRVEL